MEGNILKVTCIVGSPNINGSCAYLIETLIKAIDDPAVEIKKYFISQININYCYGCKKCYENGECVQNDDAKKVVLDVLNSDFVVIAAPSWWADVPSKLKTLFDRTTPYGDTNPNRKYKAQKDIKGIAIAVRAGVRQQENELILNSLQHYFGHLGIETIKRISVCETDNLNDLLEKHKDEIQQVLDIGRYLHEKAKS